MPTLDARPGKSDVILRPGNTTTLRFTWPEDLDGQTFDAEVAGEPLEVAVDGAQMDVVFDNVTTAALAEAGGRPVWTLTETTGGDDQVLIAGRVLLSYGGSAGQDVSSTVVVNEVSVTVEVIAGGVSDAELAAAVAAETAARIAADDALEASVSASSGVQSDDIEDIVVLTQAAYDELDPPVATTLYVIQG